jgi:hypothetical protein
VLVFLQINLYVRDLKGLFFLLVLFDLLLALGFSFSLATVVVAPVCTPFGSGQGTFKAGIVFDGPALAHEDSLNSSAIDEPSGDVQYDGEETHNHQS